MSTISDYQAFTAIVEQQSITAAANQLHRSVSAISKQLSKLEAKLGIQLIDRSTQSLKVTELGEKFYDKCIAIIAAVEEAEQDLKNDLVAPTGKLTLSFPEVLLSTDFMVLVESFCAQYPQIKFDFRISNVIEDLIGEGIDFAIRIGDLDDSRLTAIPLHQVRFILCAAPAFLEKNSTPAQAKQIATDDKALLPTYVNLSEFSRKILSSQGKLPFNVQRSHTFNSEVALHQAAVQGLGFALLLDMAVAEDIAENRLVGLFPKKYPRQQIFLIYSKRNYMTQKMRVFKDFVKEQFSNYV